VRAIETKNFVAAHLQSAESQIGTSFLHDAIALQMLSPHTSTESNLLANYARACRFPTIFSIGSTRLWLAATFSFSASNNETFYRRVALLHYWGAWSGVFSKRRHLFGSKFMFSHRRPHSIGLGA
jgi:hypothetical protein